MSFARLVIPMWTNDLMLGAKGFLRLINCYHISGFVDCNIFECHRAMDVFGCRTNSAEGCCKGISDEEPNFVKPAAIVKTCIEFHLCCSVGCLS